MVERKGMNILKDIAYLLAKAWWEQNPKSPDLDVKSTFWVFDDIVLGHDIRVRVDLVKQEPTEIKAGTWITHPTQLEDGTWGEISHPCSVNSESLTSVIAYTP
jgi:hypothetical protein